ncbi:MAG: SUMF1/EgtB/PvdO family nonheme iron enzyme, partial [Nitrospira sp.]|nr:SUMF1/EgtB/PvdO family nonheme iron enzyme [Nitrospira sp.]
MITPEELVDLAEYLKRKDIPSSSYQLFAAQQILLSEMGQDTGPTALVRLSNLLGPIFCRTAEDQRHFQNLYLEWLRQRSPRPRDRRTPLLEEPPPLPDIPTVHWRMKLAALSLLIVPLLTGWFLWQDLRPRQVVGKVLAEKNAVPNARVQVGKGTPDEPEPTFSKTDQGGRFHLPFLAKDMPLEVTVEAETYLTAKVPVGEAIKANRNWFYLNPINLADTLDIGAIQLSKEQVETPSDITSEHPPQQEGSPSELSIEKIVELSVPPPSWTTRFEGWKALGALLPLIIALFRLGYRKWRAPSLRRQASRIAPELKHVQIQTETHHLFPSISLRHLTQRLRQTRFVESAELDVARTIQCTIQRGGLFTPVCGSRREPGYLALIDRTTLADHQAHLAAQLVKDLAKGSVLVRQYEFDEHPAMLQWVDPLRPVRAYARENVADISSLEVMPLEDLHAKFPSRRLLCFGDPRLCFDPLTGTLRPWVETLEGWEERYWFSSNTDRLWGQPERILSRRGFHVVPLSHLGLRFFNDRLANQEACRSFDPQSKQRVVGSHERLPERWLERHPPSPERLRTLLDDLEADFREDNTGSSEERGRQGIRWLAACAAYPEIHWALTLEWGVRLFGHGPTAEMLLPKLTRLVWFRHAFMPDWFRQALYDRLSKDEAEHLSRELTSILSAAAEASDGMPLAIATGARKPETPTYPKKATRSLRDWWNHVRRKLRLQAMGEEAEPGSPLRDYVMLQYLSGRQGKARGLVTRAPKALLNVLFPKGQPWLGFRPVALVGSAMVLSIALTWWWDPLPMPLPAAIQAVGLSLDGQTLAIGLEDGRLVKWNWQNTPEGLQYWGYPFPVTSVALSSEGKFLAGGYRDGTIVVLDPGVGEDSHILRTHDSEVTSLAFWPSPQQIPRLVSVDAKKYVVWNDWKAGKTEGYGYGDIRALAFSQAGDWAVGGHSGGQMFSSGTADNNLNPFFNLDLSFTLPDKNHGAVKSLVWDPSAKFFLSHHADGLLRVIDRGSERVLASIQGPVEGASALSWPSEDKAFVTVAGDEGPEVWRLQIPAEVLNAALGNNKQEQAVKVKAQEKASLQKQIGAINKRIAFVVGINSYDNLAFRDQLQFSVSDAKAVSVELRKLGFEVFEGVNLTESEFYEKWRLVLDQISSQDIFLFFFSGHGVQIEGENFLLPRDVPYFEFGRSRQFKQQSIDVSELFNDLKIGAQQPPKMTLIILDASRDDPTIPPEFRSSGFKGKGRKNVELNSLPGPPGTFILYSAAPGQVSLERLGPNDSSPHSVFIRKLLPLIGQPGLSIPDLAVRVRNEVYEETANLGLEQIPSFSDGMLGMYCLAGCQPGTSDTNKRPKEPRTITGKDGAPMVLIPGGEFFIGAHPDDKAAQEDEKPAHSVFLDSFYIDRYEVTTKEYAKFVQDTNRNPPQFWSEEVPRKHGNKPVVGVNWYDANAYCGWVEKRLPTESEWEKAARGDDKRIYPWGMEKPNKTIANFNRGTDFKGYEMVTDVGSLDKGKSPYGIYDLAGNVWEWVGDWYEVGAYQNIAQGKAQSKGNSRQETRKGKVLRGGGWGSEKPEYLRVTNRTWSAPTNRSGSFGFRCARDENIKKDPVAKGEKEIQKNNSQKEVSVSTKVENAKVSKVPLPKIITGKDGAPMVLVPAGEFTMGARNEDKDTFYDEQPAHQVYLDAYYIDQYEVTTSRYAAFMEATKRNPPRYWSKTMRKQNVKLPVVGVSWEDAQAYCVWAGKRLPTEAQWEKAARGTDGRIYPWGDQPPNNTLANCCSSNLLAGQRSVGSFEGGKSPYGAYDLAGNVLEWVADWYDATRYQQRARGNEPVRNPQGPATGKSRVLRGGSWYGDDPRNLRSSIRVKDLSTVLYYIVGFRCAQGAP